MSAIETEIPGSGRFPRGVHPPQGKHFSAGSAIEILPPPAKVLVPLLQHIGAPCTATVKMRQEVAAGEMIGQSDAFISAPVHSPIAGKIAKESVATLPNGRHVRAIPITAEGEQLADQELWDDVYGGDWSVDDVDRFSSEDIVNAVRDAGIVGLGGAAFPTHVKLMPNEKRPIDVLLVNGCECEPYLTSDYRLMVEAPAPVIAGAVLAAHAVGAEQIIIGVEDNKPAAIEALREAAVGIDVDVATLHTKYPMGGEKQTIRAVLNRIVPTGGLPLDVGVVTMNVGTSAAVARAVLRGKSLTHRVVTVTGAGIAQPKNLLVPVGVSYGELIDFCGGLTADAARVIAGGPMMGFTLGDFDTPVTKGTSGVTVLTHHDVHREKETPCVRCGRCVDVCPLNLVPSKLAVAARNEDWDLARRYHMLACMECGCCAYTCPASIPLVQAIRVGKAKLPRE